MTGARLGGPNGGAPPSILAEEEGRRGFPERPRPVLFFPSTFISALPMPKSKRTDVITGDNAAITTPRSQADRLYRAAAECVRQRKRYAQLVDLAADEEEQQGALRIACICDEVLAQGMRSYESIAAAVTAHREEDWWHKANALWHAAREYDRRHRNCDQNSRRFAAHSPKELAELAMEFDLEASALLALQHAVTAYKRAVPDAEIDAGHAARVA